MFADALLDAKFRHRRELLRAVHNHKYEATGDGRILVPSMGLFIGGVFSAGHRRAIRKTPELPFIKGLARRSMRRLTEFVRGAGFYYGDTERIPVAVGANLIPTQGLNKLLDVWLHNEAGVGTWYVAPFSGDVTPQASWTYANFPGTATEFTNYDESTRVALVESAASAGSINNHASPSVFTIGAGGGTIYGAVLLSFATKSNTAAVGAVIGAAALFAGERVTAEDDELGVKYALTATSE